MFIDLNIVPVKYSIEVIIALSHTTVRSNARLGFQKRNFEYWKPQ